MIKFKTKYFSKLANIELDLLKAAVIFEKYCN